MATDTLTAADAERLHKALISERELHGKTRRILKELLPRLEAIEQRQETAPDVAQITAGLAAIRADLRAELATMRGEIATLSEQVEQFVRG